MNGKNRKMVLTVLFALMTLMTVVSVTALGILWCRVRVFEREHRCDVLSGIGPHGAGRERSLTASAKRNLKDEVKNPTYYVVKAGDDVVTIAITFGCSPSQLMAVNNLTPGSRLKPGDRIKLPETCNSMAVAKHVGATIGGTSNVVATVTNQIAKVREGRFAGGNESYLELDFSEMPKVEDLLHYVTISPKVEDITIETDSEYDWRTRQSFSKVMLKSRNFQFRTPYTVIVKPSLPFRNGARLEREFRRTIERPDLVPSVSLADSGRYLPPIGDKAVAVNVANVTNLACALRYVLPENIVQLLAREENQYTQSVGYWYDSDSEATTEIATVPVRWEEQVPHKLNESTRYPIKLRYENGIVSNGVYLLSACNADRPESYSNRPEYRLICMTDLGLSVRRDTASLRVWVTSLTTGRPVEGVEARLYASNRLPLANGTTDKDGEVVLTKWDGRYEPFALIVTRKDRTDFTFMAIRDSMMIDEPLPNGVRPKYVEADDCSAFVWTDRGIYRHNEKIMVHALVRNGRGDAPKPFPVKLSLLDSEGREVGAGNRVTDEYGAVHLDEFQAPDNLPSGKWKIKVSTPGAKGRLLGERVVKIEEFVPPQIRVALKDLPDARAEVSNLAYKVAVEHLFGGPAKKLLAESMVSFTDAEFTPSNWKGFRFGDSRRGLKPNYTRLPARLTDEQGVAAFTIGMQHEWDEPKAAVRVTIQGSAFETGGRPSVTRDSRIVHRYPYYLGTDVPAYVKQQPGRRTFRIAQVDPDGKPHREARRLKVEMMKIEYVYNLTQKRNCYSWESQRVRRPVDIAGTVQIGENGEGCIEVPTFGSGDYELVVEDEQRGLAYCAPIWISSGGDDEVRASLKNPTAVTISADKMMYHEGERPRLTVKAPFRGSAWLGVMRDRTLYTRTLELTNLTSVVELEPLDGAWAPNVDVAISVVQSVEAGSNHLAARAHGLTSLRVRTRDSELPVTVQSSVKCADQGGSDLTVKVLSQGAAAKGERAVVTVVDEGINILTNERVPDPMGFFSVEHGGWHPLYDLYNQLLPVYDARLKTSGVKTGGDDLAGLMNRVSPVPTRRFKPLSQWKFEIPLTDGVGETSFKLPEFVGEVRVTALVYTKRGTGCAAVHQKVCPKLVMQPDAPRFAAPGDRFKLTLSLFNRSGADAEMEYEVKADGAVTLVEGATGRNLVKNGDSRVLYFLAEAKPQVGQGVITYRAAGCGEVHTGIIELPVRPAVPWVDNAEVRILKPGESMVSTNVSGDGGMPELTRRTFGVSASPIAELVSAMDYLAEYPHGCLEQTTSRMFPLIHAGGILNRLPTERTSKASELNDVVNAGVARVVSMLRQNDFTMWPDCNCPPWDREVSLYAAHFLVEARTAGYNVNAIAIDHVKELLRKWTYDKSTNISAYACHTLALAGVPEKDRMFTLYDARDRLPLVARARLARAFVRIGDPKRARELVADAALAPQNVQEAAFALLAILEMDAQDSRLGSLVLYLQRQRDHRRFHWGTTGNNAHALLALASYYRTRPLEGSPAVTVAVGKGAPGEPLRTGAKRRIDGGGEITVRNEGTGDAYVSLRSVSLPAAVAVTNEHQLINVSHRFVTSEGFDVDLSNLTRGELLIGEISLFSDRDFQYADLVIQDLLPACFEPDRREVAEAYVARKDIGGMDWVLRSDMRDDRVVAFSKPVFIRGGKAGKYMRKFYYAVRVITPGEFVMPGVSVEAMYAPEIRAQTAPSRIRIRQ